MLPILIIIFMILSADYMVLRYNLVINSREVQFEKLCFLFSSAMIRLIYFN